MPVQAQSNHLNKREPFQGTYERLRAEYAQSRLAAYELDLDKELQAPDAVLTLGQACIASRGNISTVVGEAKSKKTFLASGLVGSLLHWRRAAARPFPMMERDRLFTDHIVWIDTEQSEFHARRVADRITRMSGCPVTERTPHDPRITYFTLRELDPKDRLELVIEAIQRFSPALVVLDGVADLQRNTNDLEESDHLVGVLMSLSTMHDCHILSILHANPGSDKARGHLGSALQRKSETVLYVHKVGERSLVEPQFCRNEPFDRFAFEIDEEGIPVVCELPEEPTTIGVVEQVLRESYGGAVERSVLIKRLSDQLGVEHAAASMRVVRALKQGRIRCEGKLIRLASAPSEPPVSLLDFTPPTSVEEVEEEPF